ncbi:MAG: Protein-L-isoaspartate O-methyltransferase [Candidatus Saccharicenans subterraneus]|uniref:Protein-L-isoaspartate O-methyltransferase n=1 Tax=Candidatus Saccharicenans subterraneus TaxID=2508984 RepID=A0A3E2BJI1_9BACT|nr:MAG: Protein-L-isoaspartate O-methyltransferase [Candidatus Saccharicenans subterraneum]
MSQDSTYDRERKEMVEYQIRRRGVKDRKVLRAMLKVPRHLFVPEQMKELAYGDEPLPIGEGQTISQPYIVAYMTEALRLRGRERVLEIGTGSGYQTAILAEIVREVYTVELIPELSARARAVLEKLGYRNIQFRVGDGTLGWPEHAPYEAILVSAAPASVPPALVEQLKPGGRMIIPVGTDFQELVLVTRKETGWDEQRLIGVRFVPLITVH